MNEKTALLLVIVGAILALLTKSRNRRKPKNELTLGRFLWRWNLGYELDMDHRTDAGWFTRGINKHRTQKVYKWHYLPRMERLGIRQGINLWVAVTVYGVIRRSEALYAVSSALVAGAAIVLILWGLSTARRLVATNTTVRPMALALAQRLAISPEEAEKSLTLVPDFRRVEAGHVGRFRVPDHFDCAAQSQAGVQTVISGRLPRPVKYDWHLSEGKGGFVNFRVVKPLPALVAFGEHRKEIEALRTEKYGKFTYIAGQSSSGLYKCTFKGGAPHHGYGWGTDWGKSSMMASMLCQLKHNNPAFTASIIDPKDVSLAFLHSVPGFKFYEGAKQFDLRVPGLTMDDYEQHMPDMWKGIYDVYDLMMNRYAQLEADPTSEFEPHVLVLEEHNSFVLMSVAWWKRNRPKGQGTMPPIGADKIAPIFWRGRQVNIFIVLVAQSLQERYLWNLSLRASLGQLSIAKYKPVQYEQYTGETPAPKMQKGQGRAIFHDGETPTWVQCLYGTEEELLDFALNVTPGKIVNKPKKQAKAV